MQKPSEKPSERNRLSLLWRGNAMLIALAKIPEYEGTIPPEQGGEAEGSSTPEKVFVGASFFPKSS